MSLSEEDGALIGLATLGREEYFRPPNLIVKKGSTEPAARAFSKETLLKLFEWGFVVHIREADAYTLTPNGAKRVAQMLLANSTLTPLEALEAILKVTGGISIGKTEDNRVMIRVIMGSTAFVAAENTLAEAVTAVKTKIDQTLTR